MADDQDVHRRIEALAEEEHALYERHTGGDPLSEDEQRRLRELEVSLDQCWNLLRQRRARREFGQDPAQAEARDAGTFEGYRQ